MTPAVALDALLLLGDWSAKALVVVMVAWAATTLLPRSASARRLVWLVCLAVVALTPVVVSLAARRETLLTLPSAVPANPFEALPASPNAAAPSVWGSIVAVWAGGLLAVLLNSALGLVALGRAYRRSRPWSPDRVDLEALSRRLGVRRRWRLRISSTSSPVAMTWGWLRPVVLLPGSAMEWESQRVESILLHELAHIRRQDSLFQMLASLLCAVLWFHPAVWVAASTLRADSETAADEAVLEAGIVPSSYASTLLATAVEFGRTRRRLQLAGVQFVRKGQLERRIVAIVRGAPGAGQAPKPLVVGTYCAAVLACLLFGLFRTAAASQVSEASRFRTGEPSAAFIDGYIFGAKETRRRAGQSTDLDAATLRRLEEQAKMAWTHQPVNLDVRARIDAELRAKAERDNHRSTGPP